MIKTISIKTKEPFMGDLIHAANIDIDHGGTNKLFSALLTFHIDMLDNYKLSAFDK